jgi:hypothetical protein
MTAKREPDGVEARLRASLHAYAAVVDDGPPVRRGTVGAGGPAMRRGSAGAGGPRRSSTARRWRAPALVAAAVIAVAGGAWLVADDPTPASSTAAPGSTADESGPEAAAAEPQDEPGDARQSEDAAAGPGGALVVPPPAEVGVAYPFGVYTHCGILGADVAGVWFAADPPLVEEFGPPAGWDDPYQRGTLTLESTDLAVFRDDAGHEVTLRAAESERPPPCD